MNRVVVTGLGVLAPNASDIHGFKSALEQGVSGIRHHQQLEDIGMACQIAGIPEFDDSVLRTYLHPNTFKALISVPIKYMCTAVINAWLDAGLNMNSENVDWGTGCVIGCSVCDVDQIKDVTKIVDNAELKKLGLRNIEQLMTSGVSAYVSGLLGIGNHLTTNSAACATGTESILMAYEKIKLGYAERMVAGSCEAPSKYIWSNFDNMRLLPRRYNHAPSEASRPFSATAGGFVPGSGAGALILENLDTALDRGAKIYAEVLGGAVNSGAQRSGGSMTAPNREGVIRCIKKALENTNTDPESIDLVCGHLTATIADKIEVSNWSSALDRKNGDFPYINSVKSMIGHCLSAAGSIECVAAVLQIYNQFVHPNLNCEDIHPEITGIINENCIATKSINTDIRKIIKANFGFGDVNACLVLSKYAN
jgi:3-oxoacyl-(acyl-carrier-protein) synthase